MTLLAPESGKGRLDRVQDQGRSAGRQAGIASANCRFSGLNGLMSCPSARLDTRLIVIRE